VEVQDLCVKFSHEVFIFQFQILKFQSPFRHDFLIIPDLFCTKMFLSQFFPPPTFLRNANFPSLIMFLILTQHLAPIFLDLWLATKW